MLTEKEKLEEELKLLKESLDLKVITTEEHETARQRIEAKLNDLDTLKQENRETEVKKEEEIKKEPMPEDKKEEEKIEIKEVELKKDYEEETEIKEEEPIDEEQKKLEQVEEEREVKEEVTTEEKPAEEAEEEKPQVTVVEEEKGSKKILVYISIIVILGFLAWYLVLSQSDSSGNGTLSLIACNSDDDCVKEGSIGVCNNPREENAECEYIKDVEVKLTVLNSENCFNCDTGRVLSILNGFFPSVDMKNLDFETEEGKEAAKKFDVIALPAYIYNSSLQQAHNYYKLFNAFDEVDGSYVMKSTVANSNYYIERDEIANKLDLFVKANQNASLKAEENLEEFLEAFGDNVDFEKHDADAKIVKDLGINSFPAFLINNKIKFSGVQSADKIRENFCEMNQLDECDLELSKSLV